MTITFYTNRLNHHQAPVADELYSILGPSFHFVETTRPSQSSNKGSEVDFSIRPYLIQAWKSDELHRIALSLCIESDVAVFGAFSFDYELERVRRTDKLSFELSERWLKRGFLSLLSPRLWKNQWYYHTLFYRKPLFKLCASGFAAKDQYRMNSFKGKCYKWGYFPQYLSYGKELSDRGATPSTSTRIMWCSRFLKLKHPELPVLLADRLKKRGFRFVVDMFGDGEEFISTKALIDRLGLTEYVVLHGSKPNDEILNEMRCHSIFLFTSDQHEGWGVVANESMANGCLLVSSNEIGSTPYLIKHRITGCVFKSKRLSSLVKEVTWILSHPKEAQAIREAGMQYIMDYWNPKNAAQSLIKLSESLLQGKPTPIVEGPCSLA